MTEARDIELAPVAARVGGLDLVAHRRERPRGRCCATPRSAATRGLPVRRRPLAAAGLLPTARPSARLIDGADVPVHQRVRGQPHRAEDRLDRRTRSLDRVGTRVTTPAARTASPIEPRARSRSRCRYRAGGPQGRPDRRRRRLPRRLPRRPGLGPAAPSAAPSSARCSRPTSSRRSAPRSTTWARSRFLERLADAYGAEAAAEIAPHICLPASLTGARRCAETPPTHSVGRSPSTGPSPGEDLVGRGRRPRAGHAARGIPVGVFPMGVGQHGAPPIGWWSPDPRGVLRARRAAGQPVAAPAAGTSRSGSTRRSTTSSPAAPTRTARAGGSRRRSPTPTRELHAAGLGALDRDLAGRPAGRRPLRGGHRRPLRRGVDVPHRAATPPRWPSSRLRRAARRRRRARPAASTSSGAPTTSRRSASPRSPGRPTVSCSRGRSGCRCRVRGAERPASGSYAVCPPPGRLPTTARDPASGTRRARSWAAAGSVAQHGDTARAPVVVDEPGEVDDGQGAAQPAGVQHGEPAARVESVLGDGGPVGRVAAHRSPAPSSRRVAATAGPMAAQKAVDVVGPAGADGLEWEGDPDVAVRQAPHRGEDVARLERARRAGRPAARRRTPPVEAADEGLAVDVEGGEGDDVGESVGRRRPTTSVSWTRPAAVADPVDESPARRCSVVARRRRSAATPRPPRGRAGPTGSSRTARARRRPGRPPTASGCPPGTTSTPDAGRPAPGARVTDEHVVVGRRRGHDRATPSRRRAGAPRARDTPPGPRRGAAACPPRRWRVWRAADDRARPADGRSPRLEVDPSVRVDADLVELVGVVGPRRASAGRARAPRSARPPRPPGAPRRRRRGMPGPRRRRGAARPSRSTGSSPRAGGPRVRPRRPRGPVEQCAAPVGPRRAAARGSAQPASRAASSVSRATGWSGPLAASSRRRGAGPGG